MEGMLNGKARGVVGIWRLDETFVLITAVRSRGVDLVVEIWVFDVELVRIDANDRSWGRKVRLNLLNRGNDQLSSRLLTWEQYSPYFLCISSIFQM